MTDTAQEREEFEEWYENEYSMIAQKSAVDETEYLFSHTRRCWEAWQARASLECPVPAEEAVEVIARALADEFVGDAEKEWKKWDAVKGELVGTGKPAWQAYLDDGQTCLTALLAKGYKIVEG